MRRLQGDHKVFQGEGGEALEQLSQRIYGCPIAESAQGQVVRGCEQPGLAEVSLPTAGHQKTAMAPIPPAQSAPVRGGGARGATRPFRPAPSSPRPPVTCVSDRRRRRPLAEGRRGVAGGRSVSCAGP